VSAARTGVPANTMARQKIVMSPAPRCGVSIGGGCRSLGIGLDRDVPTGLVSSDVRGGINRKNAERLAVRGPVSPESRVPSPRLFGFFEPGTRDLGPGTLIMRSARHDMSLRPCPSAVATMSAFR
jgi:hypothetical protein